MYPPDDTIVAISTAAGSGRRAIVRLSGPEALRIAASAFQPLHASLDDLGGFRAADGIVRIAARILVPPLSDCGPEGGPPKGQAVREDYSGRNPISAAGTGGTPAPIELPARAYVFRAPRSYTRQDVVELHVPGAVVVAAALEADLVAAGARAAQPGEFTARAFFSGRIDLSQAEAVADIIDSADAAQLRAAAAALGGRIHRLCQQAAADLTEVLAGVEASIDLADQAIELDRPADLASRLASLADHLADVADQAGAMPETADRPRVVLVGRPNVGKSSLLNALSGTDRAIVSATAGTTRDVLSAPLRLEGGAVTLQDAAGFAPARSSLDDAADSAARRCVAAADVLLLVLDLAAVDFAPDHDLLLQLRQANPRCPLLVLANKSDLCPPSDPCSQSDPCSPYGGRAHTSLPAGGRPGGLPLRTTPETGSGWPIHPPLPVSARTGAGLDDLRRRLDDCLHLQVQRSGDALALHERQRRCLQQAAGDTRAASDLLAPAAGVADVAELAAVDLRAALAQLGAISGQVVTEDVLGRIFARFCVGK